MAKNPRRNRNKRTKQSRRQEISIDVLPDDVLLAIFDFCADEASLAKKGIEPWQVLVHVCRRWRSVVFGSPRYLNLRLVCTTETRVKLNVWPPLPIFIRSYGSNPTKSAENIIAALKRSDCVCQINLSNIRSLQLKKVAAAMQMPFPVLTILELHSYDETGPVLPNSFLGEYAPNLRSFWLDRIPFPGLPNLLPSATHLAHLALLNIPHSGYISPDAMITALSTLTNLGLLSFGFQSPQSRPDQASRRLLPPTRFILPVLTNFEFKGTNEYLDSFVARIDVPQLSKLCITFFNDIVFDTPQFIQFITRTPALKSLKRANLTFGADCAGLKLSSQTPGHGSLNVRISCRELDWQVSSLEQLCTLCWPRLSTLEDLYIFKTPFSRPDWQNDIENVLWLELLHQFTAVRNLYLSEDFAPRIAPALQESVSGGVSGVLPALQNIFLEGLHWQPEGIQQFIDARQITGRPIVVSRWSRTLEF